MKTIFECKEIFLPLSQGKSFEIISLKNELDTPFPIRRVFYIYNIPDGEKRGAHAHRECHQMLIAITGTFEVEVYDGKDRSIFLLNKPNVGLHVPPGIWASEINFSGGGICLVLASHEYDENDYIRDLLVYKRYNI